MSTDKTDSGWRKRQIALDIKAENARELGLDYDPVHPTQRQWVGLTDEQCEDIQDNFGRLISKHVFDAIQAKLKELNT